jgi:hypothetical protein
VPSDDGMRTEVVPLPVEIKTAFCGDIVDAEGVALEP